MIGRRPVPIEERLWKHVDTKGPDECWPWQKKPTGGTNHEYAQIWHNGRTRLLQRVIYEITKGPIPEGLIVRHLCNNTICCNPAHLAAGTHTENMADKKLAGHENPPRGETHPHAKFTDEQVQAIRDATGSQYDIARRFGASRSYVSALRLDIWRKQKTVQNG